MAGHSRRWARPAPRARILMRGIGVPGGRLCFDGLMSLLQHQDFGLAASGAKQMQTHSPVNVHIDDQGAHKSETKDENGPYLAGAFRGPVFGALIDEFALSYVVLALDFAIMMLNGEKGNATGPNAHHNGHAEFFQAAAGS